MYYSTLSNHRWYCLIQTSFCLHLSQWRYRFESFDKCIYSIIIFESNAKNIVSLEFHSKRIFTVCWKEALWCWRTDDLGFCGYWKAIISTAWTIRWTGSIMHWHLYTDRTNLAYGWLYFIQKYHVMRLFMVIGSQWVPFNKLWHEIVFNSKNTAHCTPSVFGHFWPRYAPFIKGIPQFLWRHSGFRFVDLACDVIDSY